MNKPSSVPPLPDGASTRLAFWFAAVITVVLFVAGVFAPYFMVDSWSYLELSNTIFTDFYRFNTLRNFGTPSAYSQAFPPLWPVLIAIVRQVVDLGIYTGYLLNVFVCIGLLAALIRLFQRIDMPGWVGAACYLAILGYPPFLGEALGAKTLPLSLTLLTCALVVLVRDSIRIPCVVLSGLLMGLACLTRFDALATACVVGAGFTICAYRAERRFRQGAAVAVVYFATLGVTLSPLVAYGMRHFGKPFPSDNTRMVMQARGGTVLDYFATPPPADLLQNPGRWVAGLIFYKAPKVLVVGFYESAAKTLLPVFLAAVLLVWGAAHVPRLTGPAVRFTVLAVVLIPVMLLPAVLAGLLDFRYYSGPVLMLLAILFVALVSLTPGAWGSRRAALLLLVLSMPLGHTAAEQLIGNRGHFAAAMAPLSPTRQMQQITDAVRRDSGGRPHRLILTAGYITSVKYGALTHEPTSVMPRLVSGTFAAFARDWGITHVYDGPIDHAPWEPPVADPATVMRVINTPGIELVPLDLPGLYRIRLTAAAQAER